MLILNQDGEKISDTTGRDIYTEEGWVYIESQYVHNLLGKYENKDHAKQVLLNIMEAKYEGCPTYEMPSSETVAMRWRKF